MLGKRLILQMWKADYVPTFEMWARELGNMLHLEELRFILKDKLSIFHLGTNKKILTGGLNKFYVRFSFPLIERSDIIHYFNFCCCRSPG